MKIYFLRHEHRNKHDVLFRNELNAEGNSLACGLLKNYLNFLNVDLVFCSPFIRAMQTVTPYMREYKKFDKIKIDYSIAEFIHHPRFADKENCKFNLKEEDYFTFPIDKEYKSLSKPEILHYKETEEQLKTRVMLFVEMIKRKYTNTDKTILICSHMSVINMLINCFYGTKRFLESNINMGVVTTYENNQLIYLN